MMAFACRRTIVAPQVNNFRIPESMKNAAISRFVTDCRLSSQQGSAASVSEERQVTPEETPIDPFLPQSSWHADGTPRDVSPSVNNDQNGDVRAAAAPPSCNSDVDVSIGSRVHERNNTRTQHNASDFSGMYQANGFMMPNLRIGPRAGKGRSTVAQRSGPASGPRGDGRIYGYTNVHDVRRSASAPYRNRYEILGTKPNRSYRNNNGLHDDFFGRSKRCSVTWTTGSN